VQFKPWVWPYIWQIITMVDGLATGSRRTRGCTEGWTKGTVQRKENRLRRINVERCMAIHHHLHMCNMHGGLRSKKRRKDIIAIRT